MVDNQLTFTGQKILKIAKEGDVKKVHMRLTPKKLLFIKKLEKEHGHDFIFNDNEIMVEIVDERVLLMTRGSSWRMGCTH